MPAGIKEGRGRGCLVSHCTPFVVVVLRSIASISAKWLPGYFYFSFNMAVLH